QLEWASQWHTLFHRDEWFSFKYTRLSAAMPENARESSHGIRWQSTGQLALECRNVSVIPHLNSQGCDRNRWPALHDDWDRRWAIIELLKRRINPIQGLRGRSDRVLDGSFQLPEDYSAIHRRVSFGG